jgi:hypothetical protein
VKEQIQWKTGLRPEGICVGQDFFEISTHGPMVKRLRHHPFTVVSWVQIPLGSSKPEEQVIVLLNYDKQLGPLAQLVRAAGS